MELLLDENLSPRLAFRLVELYPGIVHVRDVGLRQADDRTIWDWAKEHGYGVVTTDADFVALSERLGFPPKVIHLEQCDFPFRVIEELLRRNAVRITEFEKDEVQVFFLSGLCRGPLTRDKAYRSTTAATTICSVFPVPSPAPGVAFQFARDPS